MTVPLNTLPEKAARVTPQDIRKDLSAVLDAMKPEPGAQTITLETVIGRIGRTSFPAMLLLIAVIIVSPLSGVPFLPAFFSLVVSVICLQAMAGRSHLWLPRRILQRELGAERVLQAISWLERPVGWLERRRSGRWSALSVPPLSFISYLLMMAIALMWAPLSLIPFSATSTAIGMTLIAAGLVLRDGVFVVAGFAWTALIYGGAALFLTGLF